MTNELVRNPLDPARHRNVRRARKIGNRMDTTPMKYDRCGWCRKTIYYGLYCSNDCSDKDHELTLFLKAAEIQHTIDNINDTIDRMKKIIEGGDN